MPGRAGKTRFVLWITPVSGPAGLTVVGMTSPWWLPPEESGPAALWQQWWSEQWEALADRPELRAARKRGFVLTAP